ncbi:MAG: universal stress protein [Bryobacterales bacterium]|nr:universal stress protein [Bryobacterales bacterium]
MFTSLKSIAFFFRETQYGSRIASHAATLAHRHGAHLIEIFEISLAQEDFSSYARGEKAIQQTVAHLKQQHEQKALAASHHLEEFSLKYGISIEFRVVWSNCDVQDVTAHSLHCDLAMVGHPHPQHGSVAFSPERLLLAGGAPVLIVPEEWEGEGIGNRIVLAWNGSREARRAIGDAMPFIENAQWVKVLVVDADRQPQRYGADPGTDIAHYLARHGARVEVERVSSEGGTVAETIRSFAVTSDADLLVIGAYSRARIGELLFGGVTRALLAEPSVPLLVSR